MAYDALAESVALIESRRVEPVRRLTRRRRFAAMAVDVDGDVAASMFARRGVGCIWQETHVLALRDGQWARLGGGGASSDENLLADRPAVLPGYLMVGRNPVPGTDPGIIAVGGSGGVLDGGDQTDRPPDSGRWISYADVRVNAQVTSVQVSGRQRSVPWHGHVLVVWSEREPPRVVAYGDAGRALGEVLLPCLSRRAAVRHDPVISMGLILRQVGWLRLDLAPDERPAVSRLSTDEIGQAASGMNGSPAADEGDGASTRSVVLVTGMSGTGKSTVLAELSHRGHRVIDTDDPGWIVETETASGPEPIWDLEQITAAIDGHLIGCLLIAGCVANQGEVYDRFDAVVLLSAPVDVILDRVADRANPFGSTAEDRTKIAADVAAFEQLLRAGADSEIVTTAPVAEVAAAVGQVARAAVLRLTSFPKSAVLLRHLVACATML